MESTTTVLSTIEAPAPETPAEGEAPAEGAAPVEGQAPDPGQEEQPKTDPRLELSRKMSAAAKHEARVRARETALAQKEQEYQERHGKATELEKRMEQALKDFEADPIEYYLKIGKDPTLAVQRLAKPLTEEQRRIAELEAREEQREKSWKEAQAKRQQEAEAHAQRQVTLDFIREITPNECPVLTTLHPAKEVPGLINEILGEKMEDGRTALQHFQENNGRNPTREEMRQALERKATERARDLFTGLKRIFEPSSQPASQDPDASASNGPGSLSNHHAGKISTSTTRQLSLEERRAANKARIAAELEAETAG